MRVAKRVKRWLYIGHRWLGIASCLLFAMWFGSGLVMMYVPFPSLTEMERRATLPPIRWERVSIGPDEALALSGEVRFPRDFRLAMLNDEPVYHVVRWDGARRTISAANGRAMEAVTPEQALAAAGRHPRAVAPTALGTVERDQWSVTARYDPLRPFLLVGLGDEAGTELYVSQRTGEIALDTDGRERVWNWLGSVPHWIYPRILRKDGALWRDVVLWVSGIAIVAAATGMVVGILRLRLRAPRYRSGGVTPYRGWAAWHHLGGIIGGLTLLTFIVSGWLSMNPNRWFGARAPSQAMLERYAGETAPRSGLSLETAQSGSCAGAKELRFRWLGGQPVSLTTCADGTRTLAAAHDAIRRAVPQLLPESRLAALSLLTEEDEHWYSHHQSRILPVLRAVFDDPDATWFHIDPGTGEVLGRSDRSTRTYRWVFHALHQFDFAFLLRHRPAWDVVMWALSLSGLLVAVSGVVIGWRRLRR